MSNESKRVLFDRIDSEARSCSPIRCSDLTCKDCIFMYDDSNPSLNGHRNGNGRMRGPTSVCSKYDVKPNKVLLGGECDKKKAK